MKTLLKMVLFIISPMVFAANFTSIEQAKEKCPSEQYLFFNSGTHFITGQHNNRQFMSADRLPVPSLNSDGYLNDAIFRLVYPQATYGVEDNRRILCYYSCTKKEGGSYAFIMESFL